MAETPSTTRTAFTGISSRAWEHPADRTALTALRRLKGFDQILKLLSGLLRQRQHRLLYLASSARHYKDGFDQSEDPLIRGIRDGLSGLVDGVGQTATNVADSMGRKISEWRRNAAGGDD